MAEKILIMSDKKNDFNIFEQILGSKGFDIKGMCFPDEIKVAINKGDYSAVFADYDFIGNTLYAWLGFFRQIRSKACLILYGQQIDPDKISNILQKGVYAFIPRPLLSERLYDTVMVGLENRKAFVDILGMIDELRDTNNTLRRERDSLREKNQELTFINLISNKVSYDPEWDRILPNILDAGLQKVVDLELLGILYRIGSRWNLDLHLSEKGINNESLKRLKQDIAVRFMTLSGEKISPKELALHLYPANIKVSSSGYLPISSKCVHPLSIGGKRLGMLVIVPRGGNDYKRGFEGLMSTISNILAMSLKNAREYYRLKEMAIVDELTRVYNQKGFRQVMKRELQRSRRYNSKPLSLIMIDVDDFKSVNDSFGHQAGDCVLRELAECLKRSVRKTDIVARYGGDEFVIILPETGMQKANMLMKRILRTVKNHAFGWRSERIEVKISHGISTTLGDEKGQDEEKLIQRADSRLYHLKRSGSLLRLASIKA